METIRREYEKTLEKRGSHSEEVRRVERDEPDNFRALWIARDRLAYWEGRAEGLKFALDELAKGRKEREEA